MTHPARVVAVVLAAGAARRFGGGKLTAALEGRPLVSHVVLAARDAGVGAIVLVVGADAEAVRLVASPDLGPQDRIVDNPGWAGGLASSVREGLSAAEALLPDAEAVLLLLGDQPRVPAGAIDALLDAPVEEGRPIVAPRYDADEGHNPVLLRRAGWPLVDRLSGDRGLGPLMAARPDLVTWIPVRGHNPDVDTAADLARLDEKAGP
jgi:molybdenum cofactor cytidylyltransferase